MSDQLLTVHAAAAKISMSVSWLYQAVQQGKFPRPIRLGGASRWSSREIDAWIYEQRESRRESA